MPDATRSFERFKAQFTGALRHFCEKKGSINSACRELGINRQQFAKYLSGANLPSSYVLQRLLLYFAVDPSHFFLTKSGANHTDYANEEPNDTHPIQVHEGFYLAHAVSRERGADTIIVSLWRIAKSDAGLVCHGQVPREHPDKLNMFDGYRGTIVPLGVKHLLHASADARHAAITMFLSRFSFEPCDLLAVRMSCLASDESVTLNPCLLRYIGPTIDIANTLSLECGVFGEGTVSERSRIVWRTLMEHAECSAVGIRLTV